MLCLASKLPVFTYYDLRAPARADVARFDDLVDMGLVAPAPEGATTKRKHGWREKSKDPVGLFVLTDAGKAAVKNDGLVPPDVLELPNAPSPRPSESLKRVPPYRTPLATRGTTAVAAPAPPAPSPAVTARQGVAARRLLKKVAAPTDAKGGTVTGGPAPAKKAKAKAGGRTIK